MKKILLPLLLMALTARSENSPITWNAATEDTIGNPITVDYYNVYCSLLGDPVIPINVGNVSAYTIDLPVGLNECMVTTIAKINGVPVESMPSNTVTKLVEVKPKPVIIQFSGTLTIHQ